eukprot:c19181_g1_i1 orf=25-549(-)
MAPSQRASASKRCCDAGDDDGLQKENNAHTTVVRMWKKVKEEYRLLEYHACPEYLKDNEFILSYYRADFSISQALSSLFKLHNETLNIWTHLLGFLLFLVLTVFTAYELGHLPTFSRCVQGGMEHNNTEHCLLVCFSFCHQICMTSIFFSLYENLRNPPKYPLWERGTFSFVFP